MDLKEFGTMSMSESRDYKLLSNIFGKLESPVIILDKNLEPLYFNAAANTSYRLLCVRGTVKGYLSASQIAFVHSQLEKTGVCCVPVERDGLFDAFVFSSMLVSDNVYYRFQADEINNLSEKVLRIFGKVGLENIINNEILAPASSLTMLIPFLEEYCLKTPDAQEKFRYIKDSLYTLTRSAYKVTELTSMILSMTDVSKSAVKVSALVNFIAGEFRIPVRIDDGADDLVTMIGIDIFSKIVLDILEYMLQLESLFQKKEEVKIKICKGDAHWIYVELYRAGVVCPDMRRIFDIEFVTQHIAPSLFKAHMLSEINGCNLSVDYKPKTKVFSVRIALPNVIRERSDKILDPTTIDMFKAIFLQRHKEQIAAIKQLFLEKAD